MEDIGTPEEDILRDMEGILKRHEANRKARIERGTYCNDLAILFSNLQENIKETADLSNYNTPQNCKDRFLKIKKALPKLHLATPSSTTISPSLQTIPKSTAATKIKYPTAQPRRISFEEFDGDDEEGEPSLPNLQQREHANFTNPHNPAGDVDPNLDFYSLACDVTEGESGSGDENETEEDRFDDEDADVEADVEEDVLQFECVMVSGMPASEFDPDIRLQYQFFYNYADLPKDLKSCLIKIVRTIFQNEIRVHRRVPLFKKIRIKEYSSNLAPAGIATRSLFKNIEFFFEASQMLDFSSGFDFNWLKKERCCESNREDNHDNHKKYPVEHFARDDPKDSSGGLEDFKSTSDLHMSLKKTSYRED